MPAEAGSFHTVTAEFSGGTRKPVQFVAARPYALAYEPTASCSLKKRFISTFGGYFYHLRSGYITSFPSLSELGSLIFNNSIWGIKHVLLPSCVGDITVSISHLYTCSPKHKLGSAVSHETFVNYFVSFTNKAVTDYHRMSFYNILMLILGAASGNSLCLQVWSDNNQLWSCCAASRCVCVCVYGTVWVWRGKRTHCSQQQVFLCKYIFKTEADFQSC